MEVTYMQSILKKKVHDHDIVHPSELKLIFDKGMLTMQHMMHELMLG